MERYDLIVVGGGLTGVAAAVSAAREGLKVLLAERNGSCGGAIANNLVFPFMEWWTPLKAENPKELSAGIFAEMRERVNGYHTPDKKHHFSSEYFKIVLDEMLEEAGVTVLFHAALCQVRTEGDGVKSLVFAVKNGLLELEADFYVDASGDGDLMAFAGCDFCVGRREDGYCQPMTTCFRLGNIDIKRFREELPEIQKKYKEEQAKGNLINPRENLLVFFGTGTGVVHFNTTRVVKHDPTDPFAVSRAEILARKQIRELVALLKGFESCKNAEILSIAAEIGVRESRKLRGVHVLTQEELKDCTRFEDSIALGNYDIDIHSPTGSGTSHYYFPDGTYYTIPYRSLVPKEYGNLLVAGRCLSATHEAQASVRIMPICATLGQAAGTAVAVMKNRGQDNKTVDVKEVQRILEENGAAIR